MEEPYFIAEFEDLDMLLWGDSIAELKDAFEAMLRMMWKRFVFDNSNKMTREASEFTQRLRATYTLVEICL